MTVHAPDRHDPLLDLDAFARHGAPYEWFSARRAEAPVWWHPPREGSDQRVLSVLTHELVVALGRCPHVLSSDQGRGGVVGLGTGDELQDLFDGTAGGGPLAGGELPKHLLSLDPPEHTAYRKLVNRGFTPRQVALVEDRVRSLLHELLDAHPTGTAFDFNTEVSVPLPVNVIARMLGSEPEHDADLTRWSNAAIASTDPEFSSGAEGQMEAVMALVQHFTRLKQQRLERREDDLISALLDAEVDGEALTDVRFMLFMILLTAAGNETTRTAFSHGLVELAQRPDEWQRLRDDPSLVPGAVEEVLRYSSPVLYFRRNAVEETDLGGETVRPGDIVALWYAAANRDPRSSTNPTASTSAGRRTRTCPSAAAAPTSASARRSRGWRSASCSRR